MTASRLFAYGADQDAPVSYSPATGETWEQLGLDDVSADEIPATTYRERRDARVERQRRQVTS